MSRIEDTNEENVSSDDEKGKKIVRSKRLNESVGTHLKSLSRSREQSMTQSEINKVMKNQ